MAALTASICLPVRAAAAPARKATRCAPVAASRSAFAGVALPVRAVRARKVVARAAKAESQSFDTEEVIKTLQEKARKPSAAPLRRRASQPAACAGSRAARRTQTASRDGRGCRSRARNQLAAAGARRAGRYGALTRGFASVLPRNSGSRRRTRAASRCTLVAPPLPSGCPPPWSAW